MGDKADFEGIHVVADAAARDAILAAANNRGQQCFNAIAAYGGTTTTPPLSLAQMIQTYTLDAAAVEAVLGVTGIRGNEFLSELAGVAVAVAGIQRLSTNPNSYTATGMWAGGTVISCQVTITDPDGQIDQDVLRVTLPPGNHTSEVATQVVCEAIDALVHVRCVRSGATITLSPAAPANRLESNLTKV